MSNRAEIYAGFLEPSGLAFDSLVVSPQNLATLAPMGGLAAAAGTTRQMGATRAGITGRGTTARPMTSVRASGFTHVSSQGGPGSASGEAGLALARIPIDKQEMTPQRIAMTLEQRIHREMEAYAELAISDERQQALAKAQECVRLEGLLKKHAETNKIPDTPSIDLSFSILTLLADAQMAVGLYSEALSGLSSAVGRYQSVPAAMMRWKMADIYTAMGSHQNSVKMLRMAIDQVQTGFGVLQGKLNAALSLAIAKMGLWDDALNTAEDYLAARESEVDGERNGKGANKGGKGRDGDENMDGTGRDQDHGNLFGATGGARGDGSKGNGMGISDDHGSDGEEDEEEEDEDRALLSIPAMQLVRSDFMILSIALLGYCVKRDQHKMVLALGKMFEEGKKLIDVLGRLIGKEDVNAIMEILETESMRTNGANTLASVPSIGSGTSTNVVSASGSAAVSRGTLGGSGAVTSIPSSIPGSSSGKMGGDKMIPVVSAPGTAAKSLGNIDDLSNSAAGQRRGVQRTMLQLSRLLAPVLSWSENAGYDQIVDILKANGHPGLAVKLEMGKVMNMYRVSINSSGVTNGMALRKGGFRGTIAQFETFERSALDDETKRDVLTNLSYVYIVNKDPSKAINAADRALSIDRYNAPALVNLGNGHLLNNDAEKALSFYKEAATIDSECMEAVYNTGVALKMLGRFGEALQQFKIIYTRFPSSLSALYNIGVCLTKTGDKEQAIDSFFRLLGTVPNEPNVLARLGQLYADSGNESQAIHCYSEAYRVHPSLEVASFLGNHALRNQALNDALKYYKAAARLDPTGTKWPQLEGAIYKRLGNTDNAIESFLRAYNLDESNAGIRTQLAQLYTAKGDTTEAVKYGANAADVKGRGQTQSQQNQQQMQSGDDKQHSKGKPKGGDDLFGDEDVLTMLGSE